MISMDKKYRTRNGLPVELITVSGRGSSPVLGYVSDITRVFSWTADGKLYEAEANDEDDLVEVKEKKTITVWVNISSCGHIYGYPYASVVSDCRGSNTIACKQIDIEYEEGEGL
jgi:hypothetical protein